VDWILINRQKVSGAECADGRFEAIRDVYIRCGSLADAPSRSDGEDLRRLGKVLHLSMSRALIVKLDPPRFVKPGTKACDSKLRSVGVVVEIMGPVSGPYASVRPTIAKTDAVVGRTLYTLEG
jgi:rRNA processing protein Gar1